MEELLAFLFLCTILGGIAPLIRRQWSKEWDRLKLIYKILESSIYSETNRNRDPWQEACERERREQERLRKEFLRNAGLNEERKRMQRQQEQSSWGSWK